MNNEFEIQEKRRALIAQASAITSNPDSTRAQRQHASSLLAEAASLRTDAELCAKMNSLASEVGLPTREFDETRAAEKYDREFRAYVRGGGSTTRGAALDSTSGAPFIPSLWAQQFNQKLVSYSGVLEAGATVITTTAGGSWLMPSIDDTNSNNTGVRLADSAPMSNFFPVVSLNTVPSFKYGSNGILVSNSLVEDIGFPIDDFVQDLCANRIGKIQSTEYMLGASGGPAGLIPGLSVGITSASPTAVTLAELVNLTKVVNAAYKTSAMKPCFLFNEATEATLMATTAVGSGERMYPEMSQGRLLKFPYYISNDMAGLTATSKAIVFGSIKAAATVRTTVPTLQVWNERFAEFGQTAYSMVVRSNLSVTDANAATVLQLHA